MTRDAHAVLDSIRKFMDTAVSKLKGADYEEVLGELEADIKGKLDALDEESGG